MEETAKIALELERIAEMCYTSPEKALDHLRANPAPPKLRRLWDAVHSHALWLKGQTPPSQK